MNSFIFSAVDVCQEKNSIEDKLRAKFEHEIKLKLDDLRRTLEKDHQDKLTHYRSTSDDELEKLQCKHQEQTREFERMKINHEKSVHQLNNELDRLRANGTYAKHVIFLLNFSSMFR